MLLIRIYLKINILKFSLNVCYLKLSQLKIPQIIYHLIEDQKICNISSSVSGMYYIYIFETLYATGVYVQRETWHRAHLMRPIEKIVLWHNAKCYRHFGQ